MITHVDEKMLFNRGRHRSCGDGEDNFRVFRTYAEISYNGTVGRRERAFTELEKGLHFLRDSGAALGCTCWSCLWA